MFDQRQLRCIVATNIRREMKTRALGPNALADFSGVSRSQLFDFLAGRKGMSIDWFAKIATTLRCEPW